MELALFAFRLNLLAFVLGVELVDRVARIVSQLLQMLRCQEEFGQVILQLRFNERQIAALLGVAAARCAARTKILNALLGVWRVHAVAGMTAHKAPERMTHRVLVSNADLLLAF